MIEASQRTTSAFKVLSRGIGIDMSPEAVTRRIDIVDELREFADELANASCGYLERSVNDSQFPIAFDESVNEYKYRYANRGRDWCLMIYHCPWCGGVASSSRRASACLNIQGKPGTSALRLIISAIKVSDIGRTPEGSARLRLLAAAK